MSRPEKAGESPGRDLEAGGLPSPADDTEDWFPLSPLGTEGCQWEEYYPHLEDDEDTEEEGLKTGRGPDPHS